MNPSSRREYGAIIVGARIAGCGTAALLAQRGFRVLLVDRVRFPKPTLSSPLYFSNTLAILARLGVLQKVDALAAPKLRLYETNVIDIHLRGSPPPVEGIDYSYSIRREVFDTVLYDHVAALPNVETRLGFNIIRLLWDSAHTRVVGVKGRSGGGAPEEIYADLVVGADGRDSVVARETATPRYNHKPARTCVYYAYYSNVTRAASEPTASFYFDRAAPVYCITADGDAGLTVLSTSLPAARFEEARRDPERVHQTYPRAIPELEVRLRGAVRETPIYGVTPRASFYRVPFGAGWVLVGDAGYYKDPITGQGIYDALRSAELVANAYAEFRARASVGETRAAEGKSDRIMGEHWTRVMRRYQATRDRETRGMYWLTDYYAHLDRKISAQEYELFRAIAAMPDWTTSYFGLFNGVTDAAEFIKTRTAFRIYWEWQARKLWRWLSKQRAAPLRFNRIIEDDNARGDGFETGAR